MDGQVLSDKLIQQTSPTVNGTKYPCDLLENRKTSINLPGHLGLGRSFSSFPQPRPPIEEKTRRVGR